MDVYDISKSSIDYLVNSIRKNGQFVYEVDLESNNIPNIYNIVRHAGCVYILYQWANAMKDNSNAETLDSAVAYIKRYSHRLKSGELGCYISESHNVKTGAAALTLLMYIERYRNAPDEDGLEMMKSLATFLVWIQEPNGRFASGFLIHEPFILLSDVTGVYYPGQAILGLVRLYLIDSNPKWINAALKGINYLIANPTLDPKSDSPRGHNHWFAAALQEYYLLFEEKFIYDELLFITNETIRSIEQNIAVTGEIIPGTFSSAGLATRGETLVASLFIEMHLNDERNVDRIKYFLRKIIAYCVPLQISNHTIVDGFDLNPHCS